MVLYPNELPVSKRQRRGCEWSSEGSKCRVISVLATCDFSSLNLCEDACQSADPNPELVPGAIEFLDDYDLGDMSNAVVVEGGHCTFNQDDPLTKEGTSEMSTVSFVQLLPRQGTNKMPATDLIWNVTLPARRTTRTLLGIIYMPYGGDGSLESD